MKIHFDPTGKIFRGVDITDENTSHFFGECNSTSIASFHLIQPKRLMPSAMVLFSGSSWRPLAILEEKLMSTIVVFLLNDYPKSLVEISFAHCDSSIFPKVLESGSSDVLALIFVYTFVLGIWCIY